VTAVGYTLSSEENGARALVAQAAVWGVLVCGPDPQRHVEAIEEYADAGYDHVYVHQVGADQEGFFDFYADEVMPRLGVRV
jgi:coenzyme F420-dependent glucose-6-phosphate dehydrogenase